MTDSRREAAWRELEAHHAEMQGVALRDLFRDDPARAERFTLEDVGLVVDVSKQRIVPRTFALLVELAEASGLAARRDAMFEGAVVNETEGRAALHVALRNRGNRPIRVDGEDVMPGVRAVLARMRAFVADVQEGRWLGFTGRRITDVVNIGIGGSDLGPNMAATALEAWRAPGLRGHYVSNLDGAQLAGVLADLDPASTLFVVASKTFSTQETLTNARSARRWLVEALGDESAVARHFVAVSTHRERVTSFGIDPENMFGFWDWVGGRYSLWSAIGLSVALLVGMDAFEELLEGAYAMDEHFRLAPLAANLPVVMGLLGVWNTDFFGCRTHAVLVYDWALRLLPDHLQQLTMESNGKRVRRDGRPVGLATCPVTFGGPGNNGQHAFYQLMHQGTAAVPADVIVAARSQAPLPGHQEAVLANALAQTEAFMRGRTEAEALEELRAEGRSEAEARRLAPHKTMPGNRPTTTILYPRLTPRVLGTLVALYEHAVFVQATVWDVNPFDQWGVELGKQLATTLLAELEGGAPSEHDGSTRALLDRLRAWRKEDRGQAPLP